MASTAHFNKADAQKTPPLSLLPVDNEVVTIGFTA